MQCVCVNALNGLLSFLRYTIKSDGTLNIVCQCPKRAFIISTQDITDKNEYFNKCQCPKRAFIISTVIALLVALVCFIMCQCPKRAFIISTKTYAVTKATYSTLCQCPKRAFIISTVDSQNLHK